MELMTGIINGEFPILDDGSTAELMNRTFRSEINRLKAASPTIEAFGSSLKQVPGTINGSLTSSMHLFDTEYAEVNRTLLSILALKWILHGEYDTFTSTQNPNNKLTRATFDIMRALFLYSLRLPEDIFDLIVLMVISDTGKDSTLLADLKQLGIPILPEADHDAVIFTAVQHDFLPIVSNLPAPRKEDITLGLQFGAGVNIGQLLQAECVPASLQMALVVRSRPRAFELKFLEVLLDVAGAGAHEDARSAVRMTQPVATAFLSAHDAIKDLLQGDISINDCYNRILINRGKMLAHKGVREFSTTSLDERAVLRLFAMGRVDTKEMADAFIHAFENLSLSTRSKLVDGLNVSGDDDGTAVLPYYMPGLIALGLRNTKNQSHEAKERTLESLFRLLTRVFQDTKPLHGHQGRIVPHSVSFAQSTVTSEAFRDDPTILDELILPFAPMIRVGLA